MVNGHACTFPDTRGSQMDEVLLYIIAFLSRRFQVPTIEQLMNSIPCSGPNIMPRKIGGLDSIRDQHEWGLGDAVIH